MPTLQDLGAAALFAQDNPQSPFVMLLPIMIIGVLFYVLMIRPEKRRRTEVTQMQDGLKKNDRVVTAGGIIGIVVNTSPSTGEVTIRVDDSNNTRLRMVRSSISRVLGDEKSVDSENDQQ